jgi:hypothetical protein
MIARAYTLGISRREFARLDGCSEGRVRQGISEGRLPVLADDSLDKALVGTAWREHNAARGANPAEPGKRKRKRPADAYPAPPTHGNGTHAKGDAAASVDEALRLFEQQAAAVTERVLNGASYSDALRIKENYLALLRQLEYSIKSGAVIDLVAAEQTAFDLFRGVRDAWLNWPARVAPLVAADLDFEDVDRLGAVLASHVHEQLAMLGEPQIEFGHTDSAGAQD